MLRQEKEPKEGDPDGPGHAARDYPAMLAGTGRRGTRSRSSGCVRSDIRDGRLPSRLRFSAGPTGTQPKQQGCFVFLLVNRSSNVWAHELFGAPVGPAEKRRALRGSRRALPEHPQSPDCGCELRSRLRVRASQGSRAATGTVGACFLWVLSLHEQRKYLADKRNLAVQQT